MLGGVPYLVFELDGQRYGVAAGVVREVTRAVHTIPVPGVLPHVEGALDYHGEIVAALDVRRRFGLPPRPVALTDHLIFAVADARTVALRVDGAVGISEIPQAEVTPVTGGLAGALPDALAGAQPVAGIARTPDGLVLIHDLATFLSDAEARELALALAQIEPTAP